MHLSAGRNQSKPANENETWPPPQIRSAYRRFAAIQVSRSSGSSVPFTVIGKKRKLTFAGWSRQAKAAFHELESSFFPERRVSYQVRPSAAPNWTTAPGHNPPVVCSLKLSFKGPLHSGTCRMFYGSTSANADLGYSARLGQQSAGYLPLSCVTT